MSFYWWILATINGRDYAHRFTADSVADARTRHGMSRGFGWRKPEHERGWVSPLYNEQERFDAEVAAAAEFPERTSGGDSGGALGARYKGRSR